MIEVATNDVGLAVILLVTAICAAFLLGWMLRSVLDDEEAAAVNNWRDLILEEAALICDHAEHDCAGQCAKAIREAKGIT